LEVAAHSDQYRWLIKAHMDMAIRGSNNEPEGQQQDGPKTTRKLAGSSVTLGHPWMPQET
jgi:hypothetical protein